VLDVEDLVRVGDHDETVCFEVRLGDDLIDAFEDGSRDVLVIQVGADRPPTRLRPLRRLLHVPFRVQVQREERAGTPHELGQIGGFDGAVRKLLGGLHGGILPVAAPA
jgi:hypothetical protein